jgi:AraC family transcriptional regulator
MTEGYGQRLGERLQIENAPAVVTRALRNAEIAVTELRCDNPPSELSGVIQREDAFAASLHLRDFPNREYWEDDRRASVCDLRAGESCLLDLKRGPTALLDKPYHILFFYLPRASLDAIADEISLTAVRFACGRQFYQDLIFGDSGAVDRPGVLAITSGRYSHHATSSASLR